jgi:hypothetical protein
MDFVHGDGNDARLSNRSLSIQSTTRVDVLGTLNSIIVKQNYNDGEEMQSDGRQSEPRGLIFNRSSFVIAIKVTVALFPSSSPTKPTCIDTSFNE